MMYFYHCRHPCLVNASIILFLNKKDVLGKKLSQVPFNHTFVNYRGANEPEGEMRWILICNVTSLKFSFSEKATKICAIFLYVFTPCHTKALVDDKVDDKVYGKFDEFATNTVKFATSEPLSSTERL